MNTWRLIWNTRCRERFCHFYFYLTVLSLVEEDRRSGERPFYWQPMGEPTLSGVIAFVHILLWFLMQQWTSLVNFHVLYICNFVMSPGLFPEVSGSCGRSTWSHAAHTKYMERLFYIFIVSHCSTFLFVPYFCTGDKCDILIFYFYVHYVCTSNYKNKKGRVVAMV